MGADQVGATIAQSLSERAQPGNKAVPRSMRPGARAQSLQSSRYAWFTDSGRFEKAKDLSFLAGQCFRRNGFELDENSMTGSWTTFMRVAVIQIDSRMRAASSSGVVIMTSCPVSICRVAHRRLAAFLCLRGEHTHQSTHSAKLASAFCDHGSATAARSRSSTGAG